MSTYYYIRQHDTTLNTMYWNEVAQDWTADYTAMSLFCSEEEAKAEAVRADASGQGEAEVCRRY
jgi:hypothetical protein